MSDTLTAWEAIVLDKPIGFYVEWDKDYLQWGVFGSETGFCYLTTSNEDDALDLVDRLNNV